MTDVNTWKVIEPSSYYRSFIQRSQRPDGRCFNTARPTSVRLGSVSTAEGSSTIKVGNTTVVCGIKAELCPPSLTKTNCGFIIPNVELYPCASPLFKAGPPGGKAISTGQFLQSLLQDGALVDLRELCIKEAKLCWCLFVDMVCVDYDGNLLDACVMAMVGALLDLQLPTVSLDEETEEIKLQEEIKRKITLKEKPFATSFGIYEDEILLLDPSSLDERECRGELCIVLLADGTICATHKSGGLPIKSNEMKNLIELSSKRMGELNSALDEAVRERNLR